jgi:hypothetical protein
MPQDKTYTLLSISLETFDLRAYPIVLVDYKKPFINVSSVWYDTCSRNLMLRVLLSISVKAQMMEDHHRSSKSCTVESLYKDADSNGGGGSL